MSAQNMLEAAKSYIDAIDFSMIIDKIVATKGWKRKDVEKICQYYRNFLFLKRKYQTEDFPIPPTLEIDEFWHTHILDTHKYQQDCDAIFGYYLHHYPYFGFDGKTTEADVKVAFNHLQALHHQEFGSYIYNVRHARRHQIKNFFGLLLSNKQSLI